MARRYDVRAAPDVSAMLWGLLLAVVLLAGLEELLGDGTAAVVVAVLVAGWAAVRFARVFAQARDDW